MFQSDFFFVTWNWNFFFLIFLVLLNCSSSTPKNTLKILLSTHKNERKNLSVLSHLFLYQTQGQVVFHTRYYNHHQSSSVVCAPFHRLYLFIGRERERERERQRSPWDRARSRGSNRIESIDRLYSIDRFSSRARGVFP